MHGKFIGIDYGAKRVGIALSDKEGRVAFPQKTLENNGKLAERITKIYEEEGASGIVIGESRTYAGKPNPIQKNIEILKKTLESRAGLPVYLEPEHLTSVQARRANEDKKREVDASAAAIILQSYLDRKRA